MGLAVTQGTKKHLPPHKNAGTGTILPAVPPGLARCAHLVRTNIRRPLITEGLLRLTYWFPFGSPSGAHSACSSIPRFHHRRLSVTSETGLLTHLHRFPSLKHICPPLSIPIAWRAAGSPRGQFVQSAAVFAPRCLLLGIGGEPPLTLRARCGRSRFPMSFARYRRRVAADISCTVRL